MASVSYKCGVALPREHLQQRRSKKSSEVVSVLSAEQGMGKLSCLILGILLFTTLLMVSQLALWEVSPVVESLITVLLGVACSL